MDLHISHIHHQCLYDHKTTTQEDREKNDAERKKFQELHYALGGLLMMLQKYSLLCRLTSWSNQTPPPNRLVPESMEDLIEILMVLQAKEEVWIHSILRITIHSPEFSELTLTTS